jgi:NDP-sugar pyrophosphorylase family protein
VIPKPLLPIGGIPIIEIICRQLGYYGFAKVSVSLGHLSEVLEIFLKGIKGRPGIPKLSFHKELEPLGTSGPVREIGVSAENFLVINGDVLTTMDLASIMKSHLENRAVLTIGARKTEYELPFGSLELDGQNSVTRFVEKPRLELIDNIGVYVYNKKALNFINPGEKIDVNILTNRLLQCGERVHAFRFDGPYFWIDIGTHADYEKANREFVEIRDMFPFLKGVNNVS